MNFPITRRNVSQRHVALVPRSRFGLRFEAYRNYFHSIHWGYSRFAAEMIKTTIRGIRIASIALVAYWGIIFTLTHMPMPHVPKVGFEHADKIVHFSAYAGLAFLLAWAIPTFRRFRMLNVWIAGALAMTYGAIDELTQIPVGRTADFADWIADSIGVVFGLACYTAARYWIGRRGIGQRTRQGRAIQGVTMENRPVDAETELAILKESSSMVPPEATSRTEKLVSGKSNRVHKPTTQPILQD